MPDLGKYAVEVLSAYAVSLSLLALLIGTTLHRSRSVRRALKQVEARRDDQKPAADKATKDA